MSALKNLTSLKRNITRRIREALNELQENLGNLGHLERSPVPVRIPVPVRGPAPFRGRNPRNFFHTPGLFQDSVLFAFRGYGLGSHGFQYQSSRFFSTYNRYGGFNSWRWARINQSVIFQNFSSKSQFRLKTFHRFYRTPTLTQMLKKKVNGYDENLPYTSAATTIMAVPKRKHIPMSLRLNLLLTQKFHDVVLELAKPPSPQPLSTGCYIDFKLEPKILIPSATVMSADVLGELLANLKRFERHVAGLQQDLARLSELGELPLKFVADENTIRIFFPNCDRNQLECLLVEKNVVGGVIHEDVANQCEQIQNDELVTSISDFDVLSSCNSMSLGLSESNEDFDDVLSLSDSSAEDKIVHLEPVNFLGHVEIADEYYWV